MQEAYHINAKLPVTEKITGEILSLPLHPWLKEEEVNLISEEISKYFNNK